MKLPAILRLHLITALALAATGVAATPTNAPAVLPARQVHLDFHTAAEIPDVGARFNKAEWQAALRLGHVNWINLFAKCHHSWSYYPTKIGRPHPTLQRDLLGEQIAACHELGIRCPVYFTVGWSAQDAEDHPDWCARLQDGAIATKNYDLAAPPEAPRPATSWKFLCPSGEYRDLILRQTTELCERYPIDGFFYDICNVGPACYCTRCQAGMRAEGINLDDEAAVNAYELRKWKGFFADVRRTVARSRPQASVFFNGTTKLKPEAIAVRLAEDNTEQQLEDLPTTWGGYDKLALRSKFYHRTGQPVVAMSGKFHTSWGEFGGFKHREALKYEAAAMVAAGAACNFGDQLHPSGEMDLETYANIGYAFAYVEQIEAYGVGARPVSRLGLWRTGSTPDDEGVSMMLLETQHDYVVVEPGDDLAGLETIVMTGAPGLEPAQAEQLGAFVQRGGRLVVLGESAQDKAKSRFLLDVGAEYLGPANYDEDYLVAGPTLGRDLGKTPFLNYSAALRVKPLAGAEVLAQLREPYFNRTYAHYCSHLNTPYRLEPAAHPGALRKGGVVFLPHRLGAIYQANGARVHRQVFINALDLVYRHPMIEANLPSAGRATLLHQPEHHRYVAHLLYAPPLQRGRCLVIEDMPTLRDVPLTVRLPEKVRRAYLIPGGNSLRLKKDGDTCKAVVPEFQCHTAVVFEY